MAETTILSGLERTKWQRKFLREYVRDSGFKPYMGTSPMHIIQVKNDLKTDGYTIRVPLVKALSSNGVSGNSRLGGNEEAIDQYYQDVSWEFYRNAIEISKKERAKSAPDIVREATPLLQDWASELIKYELVENFHSINGTNYSDQSEANKDTWTDNNSDRILFGATAPAASSNDHSALLGGVDSSTDKLSSTVAILAKRLAKVARPRIRPFRTGTQGREFFVMFCHPIAFRDLKTDTTILSANRDARPRDVDSNPIFQDGDLIYDGIIFREIPEFQSPRFETSSVNTETHLAGVGDSSIDVAANFLCGANSLCLANKQVPMPTNKKEDDYGFFRGMGTELAHGIEKLTWNNGSDTRKDVGVFTVYTSAAA